MQVSTRGAGIICQNQSNMTDYMSLCGMYSVNNALQVRDFLTQDIMESALKALRTTDPGVDHGDHRGGYTMAALQFALRWHGYNLLYLSD